MKTWKRILCGCLMLLFVLSVSGPVCGLAADRNYEINFYGGNGGSVSGTVGGPYTAGSGTVPFPNVTPKDGYYFKGYIESGKDPRNYEQYPGSAPTDRDRDYVAVYGIRGTEVRYTVQYLLSKGISPISGQQKPSWRMRARTSSTATTLRSRLEPRRPRRPPRPRQAAEAAERLSQPVQPVPVPMWRTRPELQPEPARARMPAQMPVQTPIILQ